jgi:hypothetical protein
MSAAGAIVRPCFGMDGAAFLAHCEAHRRARVFPTLASAEAWARKHNDRHHRGRPPRIRGVNGARLGPGTTLDWVAPLAAGRTAP